jgi:BASS family bile acid:Na+ symporter
MSATLDLAYTIALLATLWLTGISIGTAHDLRRAELGRRRSGVFARLVVLDVVVVPLVVVGLVAFVSVPAPYAAGLLIVGSASAGPLGLKTTQLAKGDLPLAIGLVVVLELLNIVAMPVWAAILHPGAGVLPIVEIVRVLVIGILLPLLVGSAIRAWRPATAATLTRWTAVGSSAGLALLIATVVLRDGSHVLGALGSGVPVVAIATILVVIGLGWLAGGPDQGTRRTGAMVSSVRANLPALVVATAAFGATAPAVSAIVVFGLCSVVLVPLAALLIAGRGTAYEAVGAGPSPSRSAPTS